MMRNADISDLEFISSLILAEAVNNHFDKRLLEPAAARGLKQELTGILNNNVRINGEPAQGLIWDVNGQQVGFVILSAISDNKGTELWMAAIAPQFKGRGEGKKMILEILNQFKGQNVGLMARCFPASKIMYHILTTNGFTEVMLSESGCRGLVYNL